MLFLLIVVIFVFTKIFDCAFLFFALFYYYFLLYNIVLVIAF